MTTYEAFILYGPSNPTTKTVKEAKILLRSRIQSTGRARNIKILEHKKPDYLDGILRCEWRAPKQ